MSCVVLRGNEARVQLTIWPLALQDQLGPLADTKLQPAGNVSVTTTFVAVDGPSLRGSIRKLTFAPAVAGTAEVTTFCAMRTSAPADTVVLAVAVLLVVSGSATAPAAGAMEALLVTVPPVAVTFATRVTSGALAPTARGPARVQVTTRFAWLHDHPLPLADTKVVEPDRLSVSTRLPEALGPALLARSV